MWLKIDFMCPENSRKMKNSFPVQCLKSYDSGSTGFTICAVEAEECKNYEKIINFQ